MPESSRIAMEITFNIAYLIVIWGLVMAMIRRQPHVPPENQDLTRLVIWAFALLALGDTGHVGLVRVVVVHKFPSSLVGFSRLPVCPQLQLGGSGKITLASRL